MDLLIAPEPNEYFSYIRSFYGVQVGIHAQNAYPDINNPIIVQPGYHAKAFITPYVVTSDEAVCSFYCFAYSNQHFSLVISLNFEIRILFFFFQIRRLPLSQRQCIFGDEVNIFCVIFSLCTSISFHLKAMMQIEPFLD